MAKFDVSVVQGFMNDTVTGERSVSSREIFEAVREKLGFEEDKYTNFQVELSTCVKSGKIVGFVGTRGRTGGYWPLDKVPQKKEAAPPTPAKVVTLGADLSMKVKKSGVTLKSGSTAMHYNTLTEALGKATELLMTSELAGAEGDTADLLSAVQTAQESILAKLTEITADLPPVVEPPSEPTPEPTPEPAAE